MAGASTVALPIADPRLHHHDRVLGQALGAFLQCPDTSDRVVNVVFVGI